MSKYFEYFKALGINPDVIFSTTVTLSIFILGIFLDRLNDWRKEQRKLNTIRTFTLEFIKSQLKPIANHIIFFKSMASELASTKAINFSYQSDGIMSDYLRSFTQIDLFKAMVYGVGKKRIQRITDFNKLLMIYDNLERAKPLWLQQFQIMVADYRQHQTDWNQSVDPIIRSYERWRSEIERTGHSIENDPFIKNLNDVIAIWQCKADLLDIKHTLDDLIYPVRETSIQYFSDLRAVEILSYSLKAIAAYNNQTNHRHCSSCNYVDEAQALQEMLDTLIAILNHYGIDVKATA
jgi:hypothetical protein